MKETQGHRKMRQHIEDLTRNEYFIWEFGKLKKELGSDELGRKSDRIGGLLRIYMT